MVYIVTSNEKTRQKCSLYETKSLLYLLNYHSDKDEVYYYVIDFYNDLTGVDLTGKSAWDVQAKGEVLENAKKVGASLVTLFKNYTSPFKNYFKKYILFVKNFKCSLLLNPNLDCFQINNFVHSIHNKIKGGLMEEIGNKVYMKKSLTKYNDEEIYNMIDSFLESTYFVKDEKNVAEYIKDVTGLGINVLPSNDKLKKIFNEIKGIQSAKKDILTENLEVYNLMEFVQTGKYLKRDNIILLVSSRILNIKGNLDDINPISYSPILVNISNLEDQKAHLEECRDGLYRLMFDVNNKHAYWMFFEEVWLKTNKYKHLSVHEIYDHLDQSKIIAARINFNSVKYFIAIVKDGLA